MADLSSLKNTFLEKLTISGMTYEELIVNILIAVFLLIAGIFIGKFVKFILRKALEKTKIGELIKPSFIKLFLVIVKWSIYILFIDLALIQLNVPALTGWLTTILTVIPSLTGALIILGVGFAIATYLQNIILESKFDGGKILAQMFFFFINYIFMILALRTAFISLNDRILTTILISIFTFLGGIALILYYFKNKI